MDRAAAEQYYRTLADLERELRGATTPDLRAPVVARMHNLVFPLFVVDTDAAQHITEALAKLKHPEQALVMAAHTTITEALERIAKAIETHPDEPFVVYGDEERVFAKPVAHEELEGIRVHGRLFAHDLGPYVQALDAPDHVARVLRAADDGTLRPALSRLGFPHLDAVAFFTTRAQPKLGVPAERIPSLRVCTLRAGIPVQLVDERVLAA